MIFAAPAQPVRPSVWLFGEAGGIQVWEANGDPRVRVAVLVSAHTAIIMLNRLLVGTPAEHDAISWALARVTKEEPAFYVWRD